MGLFDSKLRNQNSFDVQVQGQLEVVFFTVMYNWFIGRIHYI